ncbi:MAG: restriction endonuclease subunit S [Candidatus Pacebacteria bacterium]|nr:restriction endonuclease subunit S [Candidatus Paceibacterota bacterium]
MTSWPIKELREVCDIVSPGVREFEGVKKYIATADLNRNEITNFVDIYYNKRPDRANVEVLKGDILLARMARTDKFLLANIRHQNNYIFSTGFAVLRSHKNINPIYLFYFISSRYFSLQKDKLATGATQKAINNESLKKIKIPFPSLLVQQKIVERLDKIIEAQKLNDVIIKKIDELFYSSLIKEFDQIVKFCDFKKIKEICEKPQYGYTASATQEKVGPKFLRISDIQNGIVSWNDVPYCKCDKVGKYLLRDGDIVFARTGATVGKSFLVKNIPQSSVFASYLIRLRLKDLVIAEFLYAYFQTDYYWNQIMGEESGAAQPNVNGSKLSGLKIPVPSLEVQKKIVTKLFSVWEYKKQLLIQKYRLEELFESILDKSLRK